MEGPIVTTTRSALTGCSVECTRSKFMKEVVAFSAGCVSFQQRTSLSETMTSASQLVSMVMLPLMKEETIEGIVAGMTGVMTMTGIGIVTTGDMTDPVVSKPLKGANKAS